MDYILLIVGFFILIKCAGYLVDGSTNIAKKLGISNLVIGLTIVAIGTSAPELFINTISAINKETSLAFGNVVGSNITNILLVLGIGAILFPLRAKNSTVYKEVPFALLTSLTLFFIAGDIILSKSSINIITFGDSLILIVLFMIFVSYTFGIMKNLEEEQEEHSHKLTVLKSSLYIIGGIVGLALGAEVIVKSSISIAQSFGISSTIIGLTIIGIGTSLPELATGIIAGLRKHGDILIGNTIGSHIINITLGLSITGLITPIEIKDNDIMYIYIEISIITLLLLTLWQSRQKGLGKIHGIIFLIIYILYLVFLGIQI